MVSVHTARSFRAKTATRRNVAGALTGTAPATALCTSEETAPAMGSRQAMSRSPVALHSPATGASGRPSGGIAGQQAVGAGGARALL
jgi:hypothetical protein